MDIPTYLVYQGQPQFIEALTQTLREGLSDNGFTIPNVTAAEVVELLDVDPPLPAGSLWFNVDLNAPYGAMQFIALDGSLQTITSVPS